MRSALFWMLLPLRRYRQFSGRSCRKEFMFFQLFALVFLVTWSFIFGFINGYFRLPWSNIVFAIFIGAVMLSIAIPGVALMVRRLHDHDRSARWLAIGLLPVVGAAGVLFFLLQRGTVGPNRYGPDPLAEGAA